MHQYNTVYTYYTVNEKKVLLVHVLVGYYITLNSLTSGNISETVQERE